MAWRDRAGLLNFVFLRWWSSCGREREGWGMTMRTIWRIWAAMWNQEYDLPDRVWKTSYRYYYPPVRVSYEPYRGWLFDPHTKFSKSQFLMMISPISSYLSLSCAQLNHHLRTWSSVIPVYLSMQWSWVNAKYCIHRVLHTPSTAYTEYYIHGVLHHPNIDCLPPPASSHLSADLIVLHSLHSHHYELTKE